MRIATRLSAILLLALAALAFGAPAASEYRLAAPAAPTGVQATQGSYTDRIRVTWNAVPTANYYKVYRCMSSSCQWLGLLPLATVTGTTYDNYVSNANYKYYYRVRSCSSSSESSCGAWSWPIAVGWVKPERPSYISATDGTYTHKVRVTWGPVSDATGYRVYRGTNSQGYSTSTLVSGATEWNDGNITPGLRYYWWVAAYNANTGALSSLRGHDRGYRALSAPAGFGATDGAYCDKTRLLWDSVVGASSYTIERATSQYGSYGTIAQGVNILSYNDLSGTPSQIYYYRVRAKASDPEVNPSLPSNADSGFRGIPPAPSGIFATDGTIADRVNIHWGARTGALYYRLYRGTNPSFTVTLADYIQGTSYDDYSAVPGTVYYYRVASRNGCGSGTTGSADSGYRPTPTNTTIPTTTPVPSVTPQPTSTRTPDPTSQAEPPTQTPTPTETVYFRPTDYTWLPLTIRASQ